MKDHSEAAANLESQRRRFVLVAVLILLAALSVRTLYVASAKVEYPIRGDVNDYVLYAWNLTHRGVFSTDLPDAPVATPDSRRGPGYPLMLSLTMRLAGHSELPLRPGPSGRMVLGYDTDTWMRLALSVQVALGTLTVFLTMLLARVWLSRNFALAAGAVTAFWPHLIAFTGVLLSETLFAFTIVLALWLVFRAEQKRSTPIMALAGLSFGVAYLVNPVIALFPLLITGLLAICRLKRLGTVFLLSFILLPLGWFVRNADAPGGNTLTARATETFVIGSWPQFYEAYNSRFDNEISARIMELEGEEQSTIASDPLRGLAMIRARMALDPVYFAGWYLLQKPFLLWDWRIRIGWNDIYFLPTEHSPFVFIPVLAAIKQICEWANPLLFWVTALAAVCLFFSRITRPRSAPFPQFSLALFLLYVTDVHVVLQAEPRYSIPFRPEEILLAMSAVSWLSGKVMAARLARTKPSGPATSPRSSAAPS